MSLLIKALQAFYKAGDGSESPLRSARNRELVVADGMARYQEDCMRGNLFTIATAVAGVTAAAANVFSASPIQPLVGLWNPSDSGKVAVILMTRAIWNGGTPAAGGLIHTVIPNAPVTAADGGNEINNYSFLNGSVMRTYVNAAMTGSGAGLLLDYHGGPTTGALAANSNETQIDEVAGRIIVPPGCAYGLCVGAAGTSPIINASITWSERDTYAS